MSEIRAVHYINQFFAGIGGEEKADIEPEMREGAVGPGIALDSAFNGEAKIVASVICGDNYFNERTDDAAGKILEMIKNFQPDVFIAGPAFNAGRFGMACGGICKAVKAELNIPVISAMYPENPGADVYKKDVMIIITGASSAGMRKTAPLLADMAVRLARGDTIGDAETEGFIPGGDRKNVFLEKTGAKRAVEMLVKKIQGEPYKTEYPMPDFDRVPPAQALKDLKHAKIALVTSGGIVPKGNPDRIESSSASGFGKYDIGNIMDLTEEDYETVHGGYDPSYANRDADRVLPLDVLRDIEKEGLIGEINRYYYATVGNGTSVANSKAYAANIARDLLADGVKAVILTST